MVAGGSAEFFLEIFRCRKVKQQRVADIDCIVLTSQEDDCYRREKLKYSGKQFGFSQKKIELLHLALVAVSDGLRRVSQVF